MGYVNMTGVEVRDQRPDAEKKTSGRKRTRAKEAWQTVTETGDRFPWHIRQGKKTKKKRNEMARARKRGSGGDGQRGRGMDLRT